MAAPAWSSSHPGSVFAEFWTSVPGNGVDALRGLAAFPASPAGRARLVALQAPDSFATGHGIRIRALLRAPESGDYTFWISSGGSSELWVGTDTTAASARRVARTTSGTSALDWEAAAEQKSSAHRLVAGREYFVEILYKHAGANDHLAAGWRLPSGRLERPISGERARPFLESETLPDSSSYLARLSTAHPRLMASALSFARLRRDVARDPLFGELASRIVDSATRLLAQAPASYTKIDGKLLPVSRIVRERILTLAIAFHLERDVRFRDRLWREARAAAAFPDWNPDHFLDAAEMGFGLAIALDWMHGEWTPAQRDTLRNALISRALQPGLAQHASGKFWTIERGNWNLVCNSSLAAIALALAETDVDLARRTLGRAFGSLRATGSLEAYAPSGAWEEGPGYWAYGMHYLACLFASMENSLGGTFGLAGTPGIAVAGDFPLFVTGPSRRTFNFADSEDGAISEPALFWLAQRFDRSDFSAYELVNGAGKALDLLWFDPRGDTVGTTDADGLDRWFGGASQVVVLRGSRTDARASFVAIKGGDNRVEHAHLDLGTFVLDALGQRWAVDLGPDDYGLPGYFDWPDRWNYYRLRAEGHNTLVVGRAGGPDQDTLGGAQVAAFRSEASWAATIVDLGRAYAGRTQGVLRGVALLAGRRNILLQDEIRVQTPTDLGWFLHTKAHIQVLSDPSQAVLTQNGEVLWLRILSPAGASFTAADARPLPGSPRPAGQNANSGIGKLCIALPGSGSTTISVYMAPLAPSRQTPAEIPQVLPLEGAWPEDVLTGTARGTGTRAPAPRWRRARHGIEIVAPGAGTVEIHDAAGRLIVRRPMPESGLAVFSGREIGRGLRFAVVRGGGRIHRLAIPLL